MEVMISAAILVVVVLGVLASIDGVTRAAGGNKARTVAATIAEQDQERLRSLPTGDLNKLAVLEPSPREVDVAGVTYTVVSKAQWVVDSTGLELSCSIGPGEGSYLRIMTTVTSPMTGAAVRPVVLSSIVAPRPGKGTLTAMVKNAAGLPVAGIGVQAIGPTPDTKTTNASGCAVFDESDAGSYTLRLNVTNWVDPDGLTSPEKTTTVSAGNLSTVEFLYDQKSSFTVAVMTKRPGAAAEVTDRSTGVRAAHSGITTTFKQMTAAAPGATSFTFNPMFPFPSPYMVYSGTCSGNNPTNFPGLANYFTTRTSSTAQLVPGGATVAADVLEPAVDVTMRYTNGSGVVTWPGSTNNAAAVYAYPKTPGCNNARILLGNTTNDGTGKIAFPGLPFGTYDICAQMRRDAGSTTYRAIWMNLPNTNVNGTALPANFTSSSSTGPCGTATPTTS